jgi:hypothetical protein
VGGQTAEQIIAGVVLSERLAVTMYGAIHRAQFSGQRNLRGLVIDQKMLDEPTFRVALTEPKAIKTAVDLDHRNIVPTFAVESNGPDVVVVTRGVGRYVTVQACEPGERRQAPAAGRGRDRALRRRGPRGRAQGEGRARRRASPQRARRRGRRRAAR